MDRLPRPPQRIVVALVTVGLAVAIVAAMGIGTVRSADRTLVVTDGETDERLLEVPVDDGDEVTLTYTHSVEKTPVEDVYVVDGTTLRMDRMTFHSHGAGLPSDAEIERTEDGFVVDANGTYAELGVVPAAVAGHELLVGDERYDLVELADGWVVLSVSDRSPLEAVPTSAADRERDRAHDERPPPVS